MASSPPERFRPRPGKVASPRAPRSAIPQPAGRPYPSAGRAPLSDRRDLFLATRRAIKYWWSLGDSRWVVREIIEGVLIPWRQRPPRYRGRGDQLSRGDEAWAREEFDRLLEAGYIRELSAREEAAAHCVMGALVTHSAGKPRLVEDSRHANSDMEPRRLRYETLLELASGFKKDDQHIVGDRNHSISQHIFLYFNTCFKCSNYRQMRATQTPSDGDTRAMYHTQCALHPVMHLNAS